MQDFIVYPAIDLRNGKVVRLVQGDPGRQTIYADDPAAVAREWLQAGAGWLHVVNLDGAFDAPDQANQWAVREILKQASLFGGKIQLGGGLRDRAAVETALELGVRRVLLGTAAVQNLELIAGLVAEFGPAKIGAALDAEEGIIRVRGWQATSGQRAVDLGMALSAAGVRTVIYTDIARDGTGQGVNLPACQALQTTTGLEVIASGGVSQVGEVRAARAAGLVGIIIGRALYQGNFTLQEALRC